MPLWPALQRTARAVIAVAVFASAASLLLSTGALAAGQTRPPVPRHFAFNWLSPDARCQPLTAYGILAMQCSDSSGAFGLHVPSRSCRVSSRVEWMVYRTQSECSEALRTMQANAP